MKHNSLFDIGRFNQLVTNDLRINQKPIMIAAAVILVFWALISLGGPITNTVYAFTLYIGGFILTSRSFKELHNSELAYHYLTLPCSNLERFLSKWLITSIGYALALVALVYLFTTMHTALIFVLWHKAPVSTSIFDPTLWQTIGTYIVLHSMVFLGAVFFKRYCLLKTALFLGCLMLTLSYFVGYTTLHLYPYWVSTAVANFDPIVKLVSISFWFVLAPFCWAVTYVRISEYEIN
jgi:hypothetical protein